MSLSHAFSRPHTVTGRDLLRLFLYADKMRWPPFGKKKKKKYAYSHKVIHSKGNSNGTSEEQKPFRVHSWPNDSTCWDEFLYILYILIHELHVLIFFFFAFLFEWNWMFSVCQGSPFLSGHLSEFCPFFVYYKAMEKKKSSRREYIRGCLQVFLCACDIAKWMSGLAVGGRSNCAKRHCISFVFAIG